MRRFAVALLAVFVTLGTVPAVANVPLSDEDPVPLTTTTSVETEEATVESFDGHPIPIQVYESTEDGPSPTLLWGHGWAGSYGASSGDGEFFAQEGYNVVAMDFRGHGNAREDSVARVHSPAYEIRDVRQVIDFISNQSWAQLEATGGDVRGGGDPVLGALGGSYGGGYQLLTAAADERLDAIAPEITWNSLPQSLAPNGAVKSTWVDLLYGAGVAGASLADFIHQGYAWSTATNEFPTGDLPAEPDVAGQFSASSPASYPDAIDVPALIIQGLPDALFNLNQAVDNARQLEQAGSPEVNLVTHLGGHIVNTDGTLGADEFRLGLQAPEGPSPCGDTDDLRLAWYDDHLKNEGDDQIRRVEMALSQPDGEPICSTFTDSAEQNRLEAFVFQEAANPTTMPIDEPVLLPASQGVPAATLDVEGNHEIHSPVQRTVYEADQPTELAGIPQLSGTVDVTGTSAIVFVSTVVDSGDSERVVHDQVMPLRVEGPSSQDFTLDLTGVGTTLDEGDVVEFEFSTTHPMYADNGGRQPGVVELSNLEATVPVVG